MLKDGIAKVRQIRASERAVPIATITLPAIELRSRFVQQRALLLASVPSIAVAIATMARLAFCLRRTQLMQPATDHLHPSVHLIRCGILHLEVPPIPAANERSDFLPSSFSLPVVLAMHKFF